MYAFLRLSHSAEPDGGVLRSAVAEIRSAKDFKALESASEQFRNALSESGIESTRSFVVAIVSRIVRPGSTAGTDRIAYLVNALHLWRRKSADKLGVSISILRYGPYQRNACATSPIRHIRLLFECSN